MTINSIEQRASPDGGHEERKRIPQERPTLLVNGIGPEGVSQMIRFLGILNQSRGGKEVLAVSAPDADTHVKFQLDSAVDVPFFGRKPLISIGKIEKTLEALQKRSEKHGETLKVGLHFISYENGEPALVKETVESFSRNLSGVQNIGILTIPSDASFSPDQLGIPLIVIDQKKCQDLYQKDNIITPEDGVLYGLAGLVASNRSFPDLNTQNYTEILQGLTAQKRLIGVSVGIQTAGLYRHGLRFDLSLQALPLEIGSAIVDSLSDYNNITPFIKDPNSQTSVVVASLPLDPKHPSWKDPQFFADIKSETIDAARIGKIPIPSNLVSVFSYARMEDVDRQIPIVSAHFFPSERVV